MLKAVETGVPLFLSWMSWKLSLWHDIIFWRHEKQVYSTGQHFWIHCNKGTQWAQRSYASGLVLQRQAAFGGGEGGIALADIDCSCAFPLLFPYNNGKRPVLNPKSKMLQSAQWSSLLFCFLGSFFFFLNEDYDEALALLIQVLRFTRDPEGLLLMSFMWLQAVFTAIKKKARLG